MVTAKADEQLEERASRSFKKIVVPLDGSEPSRNALMKSAELFLSLVNNNSKNIEFVLLQVIPFIEMPLQYDANGMANPDYERSQQLVQQLYLYQKEKASDMLAELASKLKAAYSKFQFAVSTEVLYGNPADKIIEFANTQKADLIVIGNIGLSGFSKLKALGSVSRRVSESSQVPVMIIHHSG